MTASTAHPQPSLLALIGLRAWRESARTSPGTAAPSVRALTALAGRVPSGLSDFEVRELDTLAFGYVRRVERERERAIRFATLHQLAAFRASYREPSLIASMGADPASVQPWQGVIGAEGMVTGDGRLIKHAALTWAALPLPLRYAAADHGGHDGAVLVGRIDSIERRKDGTIFARGVLDLGSEVGREAARLIRAGLLSGVSMDLDSTDMNASTTKGSGVVVSGGRVRAATLVAIPAFDLARIALTDTTPAATPIALLPGHAEDCGCDEFPGLDAFPGIDQMPTPFDYATNR